VTGFGCCYREKPVLFSPKKNCVQRWLGIFVSHFYAKNFLPSGIGWWILLKLKFYPPFDTNFFLEQDKRERTDNICTSIVCTNLRSFSCSPMGDDKKKRLFTVILFTHLQDRTHWFIVVKKYSTQGAARSFFSFYIYFILKHTIFCITWKSWILKLKHLKGTLRYVYIT